MGGSAQGAMQGAMQGGGQPLGSIFSQLLGGGQNPASRQPSQNYLGGQSPYDQRPQGQVYRSPEQWSNAQGAYNPNNAPLTTPEQRQQIAASAPDWAKTASINAYGQFVNNDGSPFQRPAGAGATGGVAGALRGEPVGGQGGGQGQQGWRDKMNGGPRGNPHGDKGNPRMSGQGQVSVVQRPQMQPQAPIARPTPMGQQLQSFDLTGMPGNLKGF